MAQNRIPEECTSMGWFRHSPVGPTPKTTTREEMEKGRINTVEDHVVAKKLLTFQSYPRNDFRFEAQEFTSPPKETLASTYKRDYMEILPRVCEPPKSIPDLDPLFNRKPKNDFELTNATQQKFMDDHFRMEFVSEGRKKINYFRQLRNVSRAFEAFKDQLTPNCLLKIDPEKQRAMHNARWHSHEKIEKFPSTWSGESSKMRRIFKTQQKHYADEQDMPAMPKKDEKPEEPCVDDKIEIEDDEYETIYNNCGQVIGRQRKEDIDPDAEREPTFNKYERFDHCAEKRRLAAIERRKLLERGKIVSEALGKPCFKKADVQGLEVEEPPCEPEVDEYEKDYDYIPQAYTGMSVNEELYPNMEFLRQKEQLLPACCVNKPLQFQSIKKLAKKTESENNSKADVPEEKPYKVPILRPVIPERLRFDCAEDCSKNQ